MTPFITRLAPGMNRRLVGHTTVLIATIVLLSILKRASVSNSAIGWSVTTTLLCFGCIVASAVPHWLGMIDLSTYRRRGVSAVAPVLTIIAFAALSEEPSPSRRFVLAIAASATGLFLAASTSWMMNRRIYVRARWAAAGAIAGAVLAPLVVRRSGFVDVVVCAALALSVSLFADSRVDPGRSSNES